MWLGMGWDGSQQRSYWNVISPLDARVKLILGELEPKDDRALQKIRRKKQAKNVALLMEVPGPNRGI